MEGTPVVPRGTDLEISMVVESPKIGSEGEKVPCLWKIKMQEEKSCEAEGAGVGRRRRVLPLDILVAVFGVGAWVGINGTYVQLPLLVNAAPEGWQLPNNMAIAIQIANIGPLAYSLLRKIAPNFPDSIYIYAVLALGSAAATLNAFLYNVTTDLGGQQRSTVFLTMVFFIALVGCTSSVLFYPFMRHYRDIYLISYLIGEGLSGFLPSIAALIQGVGGNQECVVREDNVTETIQRDPRFGTTPFLLFVAALIFMSLLAFIFLNVSKIFDSEKVDQEMKIGDAGELVSIEKKSLYTRRNVILLCLMAIVCAFGNGVYPSIQSYSCLPYGNVAYHLAITLSSMANPLACFLAVFLPKTSNLALASLSNLCFIVTGYILATALLSPAPPLRGQAIGEALVVISWIAAVGLVSYIKLCVATVFRGLGAHAMFVCGAVSQVGSAIGSLLLFLLLDYTHLFVANDPCH